MVDMYFKLSIFLDCICCNQGKKCNPASLWICLEEQAEWCRYRHKMKIENEKTLTPTSPVPKNSELTFEITDHAVLI